MTRSEQEANRPSILRYHPLRQKPFFRLSWLEVSLHTVSYKALADLSCLSFYEGWFIIVSVPVTGGRSEMYQLSSRARMELENYLTEEYPKQTDKNFECIICNEVVFKVRFLSASKITTLRRFSLVSKGQAMQDESMQDANARPLRQVSHLAERHRRA